MDNDRSTFNNSSSRLNEVTVWQAGSVLTGCARWFSVYKNTLEKDIPLKTHTHAHTYTYIDRQLDIGCSIYLKFQSQANLDWCLTILKQWDLPLLAGVNPKTSYKCQYGDDKSKLLCFCHKRMVWTLEVLLIFGVWFLQILDDSSCSLICWAMATNTKKRLKLYICILMMVLALYACHLHVKTV